MSLRGSGGEYLLPRRATGGAYVAPGVERWLSPFPLHCPLLLLECPLLLVPSRLPKYGSVSLVQLGEGGWVWHFVPRSGCLMRPPEGLERLVLGRG